MCAGRRGCSCSICQQGGAPRQLWLCRCVERPGKGPAAVICIRRSRPLLYFSKDALPGCLGTRPLSTLASIALPQMPLHMSLVQPWWCMVMCSVGSSSTLKGAGSSGRHEGLVLCLHQKGGVLDADFCVKSPGFERAGSSGWHEDQASEYCKHCTTRYGDACTTTGLQMCLFC